MWLEIAAIISSPAAVLFGLGWHTTRRRLAQSARERNDLENSSHVIEEERKMLELIAGGALLNQVLNTLTTAIETISPGAICTVMLLDEEHRKYLHFGSAPALPTEYLRVIDGLEIGPDVGACGSAAFHNETVVVEDISTDYRFAGARDFVLSHGLRSCWSQPVRDSRGNVLGTFAIYHRHIATPRSEELRMTRVAAQLAGNAIERIRAAQALKDAKRRLHLAERVAHFGVWEADFDKGVMTISEGMALMLELPSDRLHLTRGEFEAFVYPDDLQSLRDSVAGIVEGIIQNEFRLVLPSGALR